MNRIAHPMTPKIEQAAQAVMHGGAVVSVSSMFTLPWWNENSAGIVAMAAVLGALSSIVGLIVSLYLKYRNNRDTRE